MDIDEDIEIDEEMDAMLDEIIECFNIRSHDNNRQKLIRIVFALGVNALSDCLGKAGLLQQAFPELTIPVASPAEEPPQEEPKQDEHAPDRCPKCGKRVIWNASKLMWVCNCRGYEVSPKPEPVCPHCKGEVVPHSYYWQCMCNRYDCRPDAPAEVKQTRSNGFPS